MPNKQDSTALIKSSPTVSGKEKQDMEGNTALEKAIVSELEEGKTATIRGLGSVVYRTYDTGHELRSLPGVEPKTNATTQANAGTVRLPFFRWSKDLRLFINGKGDAKPFSSAELVTSAASASGLPPERLAAALTSWGQDTVESLRRNGLATWWGLGIIEIGHFVDRGNGRNPETGEMISLGPRSHLSFKYSNAFFAASNRKAQRAFIPSDVVSKVLREFPAQAFQTSEQVSVWLDRLDTQLARNSNTIDTLAEELGHEPSELLKLAMRLPVHPMFASKPRLPEDNDTWDIKSFEDDPPDTVFAFVPDSERSFDGLWTLCQHVDSSGYEWVYNYSRGTELSHDHTQTIAGWLSGLVLIAALRHQDPEAVLTTVDALGVMRRLRELKAPMTWEHIPF